MHMAVRCDMVLHQTFCAGHVRNKRHRRRGVTWCCIGCFVRDIVKQTCNTSSPQGIPSPVCLFFSLNRTIADAANPNGMDRALLRIRSQQLRARPFLSRAHSPIECNLFWQGEPCCYDIGVYVCIYYTLLQLCKIAIFCGSIGTFVQCNIT